MKINPELKNKIAEVVRARASLIGRQSLNDVEVEEIEVLRSFNDGTKFTCRIRGMTYTVNIVEGAERFGTYEAGEVPEVLGVALQAIELGTLSTLSSKHEQIRIFCWIKRAGIYTGSFLFIAHPEDYPRGFP